MSSTCRSGFSVSEWISKAIYFSVLGAEENHQRDERQGWEDST